MTKIQPVICICLVTILAHLVGSAVFFGWISGPLAMLASPLLSVFGWFFIIPEFFGVMLQWLCYNPKKGKLHFWITLAISMVLAGLFTAMIGPKEQGSEAHWAAGYFMAATSSAALSLVAIRLIKKLIQPTMQNNCDVPADSQVRTCCEALGISERQLGKDNQ